MAKFTDAWRNTLSNYFNAGDQPTEAQFTQLMLSIQEGIEEHQHDGTGDGDGVNNLGGPVGISGAPTFMLTVVSNAAGNDGIVIVNAGAGSPQISFDNPLGAQKAAITWIEDTSLRFYVFGHDIMTLTTTPAVGIGLVGPTSLLHVEAADGTMVDTWTAFIENKEATAGDNWGLGIKAGTNAADVSLRIEDTSANTLFTVQGDGGVIITGLAGANQAVGADAAGKLYVPHVSDRKFKDNIKPLTGGLEVIKALRPVTFDWKPDELAKVGLDFGECGQQVGLVAQEVVEVIPQAKSDGRQYKSYDKSMITPYLIEAIKELDIRLTQGGL